MTPLETMAAAIANARGGRRGAPPITNVLDILKGIKGGKLYDEVMEDARAMVEALIAMPLPDEVIRAGWIDKEDVNPDEIFRAMLMACLK